jgi:hypothetical protein
MFDLQTVRVNDFALQLQLDEWEYNSKILEEFIFLLLLFCNLLAQILG